MLQESGKVVCWKAAKAAGESCTYLDKRHLNARQENDGSHEEEKINCKENMEKYKNKI